MDNSASKFHQNTSEVKSLKIDKLIIWDECTMMPIHNLNTDDRFLRDLVGNDVSFGGKLFLFGVHWWQILPVTKQANKTLVLDNDVSRILLSG